MKKNCKKVKRPDISRIEKVLKKRTKNKKKEYLVRWSGYEPDFDSWIQSSDIEPISKNERKCQRVSFHLVLPSTSSHEIFLENHAGKFTVMLPKEIQLDQNFHWEMALVELFWPKQDSIAVIENLWYETQRPNRKWKRTYAPSSAF